MSSYAVNHPRNCYCRSLSRQTYDEILAQEILPLVPRSEWNILWDAEALPASVGRNHQINAYSVLRHIFLFLPLDTGTLLATASTCRSWRILSDRLPHWRILLPLKYEMREIVSKMHWHLPAAWEVEKIPYEISEESLFRTNYHLSKSHASETDDSKFCHHLRLRGIENLSDSLENRFKEEYDKVGWLEAQMLTNKKIRTGGDKRDWACSCEEDGSLISCPCLIASACFCSKDVGRRAYADDHASKRSDDVNLQEIERARILQFLNHGNGTNNDNNDYHFAELAIGNNVVGVHEQANRGYDNFTREDDGPGTEQRTAIDWFQRLEPSRRRSEYENPSDSNNNPIIIRNQRGVWNERNNDSKKDSIAVHRREPFEDRRVASIGDKNPFSSSSSMSQKMAGVYHECLSDYFEKKIKLRKQIRSATAIKAALDAGISEEEAALFSNTNDDDDDDEDENSNNNNQNSGGAPAVATKLTAQEALKILADAENEKQVMLNRNPVLPLQRRIVFQSISGAPHKPRDYMHHYYLDQSMSEYDAARPEDRVARKKGESLIKFLVERDDHRTDSRTYLRAIPMTLLENADYIMNCPEHRRRHCFLTFSSFAEETRELMKEHEETVLNFVPVVWKPCWYALRWFPEMTRELNQWVGVCSFLLGLCLIFALVIPAHLDSTHISQTDTGVGGAVGGPCVTFVFVYFLSMMKDLGNYHKYGNRSKVYGQGWMFLICTSLLISLIVVPLALVNFRTTVLDKLVNGGEISIENFYASKAQFQQQQQLSSSILNRINAQSNQCKLPPEYLPTSVALKSTFVYFPPGTKLLYNPPNVGRAVPFASIFDASNNSCRIQNNSLVRFDDLGFNQAKNNLVSRGSIGYYTVFLPESQSASSTSASFIKNFTLLILGDFSSCPFWSVNNSVARTANSSLASQENIHPRFRSLLKSRPSSEAIGNASLISKQLEDALINLEFNSTNTSKTLICQNTANALIEVAGPTSSGEDVKKLHLRVSSEFSGHFTSYFDQSATHPDGNGVGSWANSLEYQLNGVVALMADSSIFNAHENSASPVVPKMLADDRIFSSSFISSNRIWSSATPSGLKNLQSDFHDVFDRILVFLFVFYFGFCVFGIFCCAGGVRENLLQLISGFLVFFVLLLPIPALVVTSLCFQHGVENVKDELRQPIVCLAGSRADIIPAFAVSIVQISISMIGACCLGCLLLLMGCGRDSDQENGTD